MFHLHAPLVMLYKQYPRFIHLLAHVNRHIFVYRFVYPTYTSLYYITYGGGRSHHHATRIYTQPSTHIRC
jgi:hypothetical protein